MNPGYNFQTITNPLSPSLAVTYDTTISGSTEITLNEGTTYIEVSAITSGIFLSWGAADASTSNFDEYISPNQTRLYAVPESAEGVVNFIQAAANGILILIEK